MTPEEIKRRLRALCAMPVKDRPFSLRLLERLTGIRDDHLKSNADNNEGMYRNTRRALDRAFTLLENGQVDVKKGRKKKGVGYKITIREDDPRPVQSMLTRIRMTGRGPVLDFIAVNKAAFPVLPPVNK